LIFSFRFRPRGLAGALLIIKVAGALAEQGKTMSEIVDVCQNIRTHLRTIGLSASGIRAPGHQQSFEVDRRIVFDLIGRNVTICFLELLDDEMELGMGIHGESGAQKLKLLPSRHATDLAFGQLFRGSRALDIKRDDNVLLFVNNLGK
jgi:triose/dihydroxyacetone kinase / FAD-AMP lyase (cyclizing)